MSEVELGSDAGGESGAESEDSDRGGMQESRRWDLGLDKEHLQLEEREVGGEIRNREREEGAGRKRRREAWSADMERRQGGEAPQRKRSSGQRNERRERERVLRG